MLPEVGRSSPGRTLGDALIGGVAWFADATVVTRNPDDLIAQGIPVLTY
jgi:predicted nucleic acid-binding protein